MIQTLNLLNTLIKKFLNISFIIKNENKKMTKFQPYQISHAQKNHLSYINFMLLYTLLVSLT